MSIPQVPWQWLASSSCCIYWPAPAVVFFLVKTTFLCLLKDARHFSTLFHIPCLLASHQTIIKMHKKKMSIYETDLETLVHQDITVNK